MTQYTALRPQLLCPQGVKNFISEKAALLHVASMALQLYRGDRGVASNNRHLSSWEGSIRILLREHRGEHPGHSVDCARHLQDCDVD